MKDISTANEEKEKIYENRSKRIKSGFYSAIVLYLIFCYYQENIRIPSLIITLLIICFVFLAYREMTSIIKFGIKSDQLYAQSPKKSNFKNFRDYRFSEETQQKVATALNKGMIQTDMKNQNDSNKIYQTNQKILQTPNNILDQKNYENDSKVGFFDFNLEKSSNGISRTPRLSAMSVFNNNWSNENKVDSRKDNTSFFKVQEPVSQNRQYLNKPNNNGYFNSAVKNLYDPDPEALGLSNMRYDPRNSIISQKSYNNPMYSKNKNSIYSKVDPFDEEEIQNRNQQNSEAELTNLLHVFKVDLTSYRIWSTHNIPTWISCSLIPDIIARNFENLKKINELLNQFMFNLVEYHFVKEYEDENYHNTRFQNQLDENEKNWIDIDEFLRCSYNNFVDFRHSMNKSIDQSKKFEETIHNLGQYARDREKLDCYFNLSNIGKKNCRLQKLCRLYQIRKENIFSVYDESEEMIKNEELVLDISVQCIRENDPYYKINQNRTTCFTTVLLRNIEVNKDDFFIEKNGEFLILLLNKSKTTFVFNLEGTLRLVTFLLHFVKQNHFKFDLKNASNNLLTEILRNIDLRSK